MKIVINNCFGGFGLSLKAIKRYLELKGKEAHFYVNRYTDGKVYKKIDEGEHFLVFTFTKHFGKEFINPEFVPGERDKCKEYHEIWDTYFSDRDILRDDKDLIKAIEELGTEANGDYADLKIVEIPDGTAWQLDDYDGNETIHETHRTWE